ncbi:hypothetical protein ES703_01157 [subsurface metagenome]
MVKYGKLLFICFFIAGSLLSAKGRTVSSGRYFVKLSVTSEKDTSRISKYNINIP